MKSVVHHSGTGSLGRSSAGITFGKSWHAQVPSVSSKRALHATRQARGENKIAPTVHAAPRCCARGFCSTGKGAKSSLASSSPLTPLTWLHRELVSLSRKFVVKFLNSA